MKVIALPRDRNPYQNLLYGEMERLGTQVAYLGELTPSHTVNLVLLPLELAARRATGSQVVHLHWVFPFAVPGGQRFPLLRWLAQRWFALWLRSARLFRLRLVWTAHNVLPHSPVFADEVSARRALVKSSDLVIAHSPTTLRELAALGAAPQRSAVIPHGPFTPTPLTTPLPDPGADGQPCQFLFFGKVAEYKGVEELLAAFTALPGRIPARLAVVGECHDPGLRSRLHRLADQGGSRVSLRLDRVPDGDVTPLLTAADVVVLPFRRVTTSGSAILALSHGRPLIVPELPALADLPDQALLRYDGTVASLTTALERLAQADVTTLAAMSAAARSYATRTTWPEIAARTRAEMISLLSDSASAGPRHAAAVP
jgi:glycosyltransferase involved in cell wall biosynthesis